MGLDKEDCCQRIVGLRTSLSFDRRHTILEAMLAAGRSETVYQLALSVTKPKNNEMVSHPRGIVTIQWSRVSDGHDGGHSVLLVLLYCPMSSANSASLHFSSPMAAWS